jgi:hypothetical protein
VPVAANVLGLIPVKPMRSDRHGSRAVFLPARTGRDDAPGVD